MVSFQTKNPYLGKYFRVLQWKRFVYCMAIRSILRTFGIIYGHLVYLLVTNWYIFSCFGKYYREISGNPGM
jgi:hypothetical protein